ncbi:MAG TPA: fatty acid--CoA ligase family protein [Verrucomicrobiae bacterium]|jgi:acyl-coenzyme A synthetase/AMP-(fatty) acid ligase|nr:fatty acid--CoA ligase family protein [Verrucomicrobiae bacterium]
MLYERWKKISADLRNETALRDFASGRRWTFGELFAEGEKNMANGEIIFPQNHSPEFIFQLLAAWRENKIACPLEAGQLPTEISQPPKNCVHLKTTSATGGAARFVAFTAEQLMADAENIVATMGLRADWPNLGVISLAHSYGFSNLILPLLLHGVPLILAPAPLPEIIRRAAETEKFLTLAAVPAMWRAWHEAGSIPANVHLAISAGAPLPLNLEREIFKSCGLKIHNFLGSSECGGIAYDATDLPRTDAACVGAPMQNVNLSLNEDGCLIIRSRAVAETYWPEKSDSLGGGIFQTSDLAELKNGSVFLRGRLGDQINVAGRKISPETIEGALLANPKVRECLVFGAPSRDAERTEIIVAVIVSGATENELKQFLLQTLPAWQVPRDWKFVDSLSTNARGKISRAEWRAAFVRERV